MQNVHGRNWSGQAKRTEETSRSAARLIEEAGQSATERTPAIASSTATTCPPWRPLLTEIAGQVKCAYIDPPYNTSATFDHYADDADLPGWLAMMHPRLVLLHKLLREDGVLFVQIDGRQVGYLKVLLDEVFGRSRWLNDIVWKRRGGSANPETRG